MKILKLLSVIMLSVSLIVLSVCAAEFVPSIERPENHEVIDWSSETDESDRLLILVAYTLANKVDFLDRFNHGLSDDAAALIEELIRQTTNAAAEELEKYPVHKLIDGFDAYWDKITGGAPLENCFVYDVFNVSLISNKNQMLVTDEQVSFSFKVDGITIKDKFVIIHKPTNSDKWIIEEHDINENNVITIHADSLSPFAIIKDSGKAPSTDKDSPQTGVSENGVAAAAVCAMILAVGAVVASKKLKKA